MSTEPDPNDRIADLIHRNMSFVNPFSGETRYDRLARELTGNTDVPRLDLCVTCGRKMEPGERHQHRQWAI